MRVEYLRHAHYFQCCAAIVDVRAAPARTDAAGRACFASRSCVELSDLTSAVSPGIDDPGSQTREAITRLVSALEDLYELAQGVLRRAIWGSRSCIRGTGGDAQIVVSIRRARKWCGAGRAEEQGVVLWDSVSGCRRAMRCSLATLAAGPLGRGSMRGTQDGAGAQHR